MNRRSILAVIAAGFISSCSLKTGDGNKIILTNTSSIALKDKAIRIDRAALPAMPAGIVYPLILSAGGDTLAAQLDDLDGDNQWDELFFVVNLPAEAAQPFSLKWVTTQPVFEKRTSARFGKRMSAGEKVQPATSEIVYALDMPKRMGFQRYQTDGPSWENDKVGFRHYLDGRNARDVFGKKVAWMSPENTGINAAGAVEDNYHVMEDWGRDIMAVGNSIGIGGVALLKQDSIMRLGVTTADTINNVEETDFHIVTEGPVRSMLNFKYKNWKPFKGSYTVDETTSIWPGMYAYYSSVKVSGLEGDENLLIGMVNIYASKPPEIIKINDRWVALISHEKHTYNQEWWLGLALIVPADDYLGIIKAPETGKLSNSFLVKLKIGDKPVNYYSVAGWELSDEGFKDPAYFRDYVQGLAKQISADVTVEIE